LNERRSAESSIADQDSRNEGKMSIWVLGLRHYSVGWGHDDERFYEKFGISWCQLLVNRYILTFSFRKYQG
jgi:hypothetical protein